MVGIREVRTFIHRDEPAENASRLPVEGVFVEKVAAGVGSLMILQSPLVHHLIFDRQGNTEHITASPLADEIANALTAAEFGTQLHLEAFDCRIPPSHDAGKMQSLGIIRQFLTGGVSDSATRATDQISDGNTETALPIETAIVIHQTDFRIVLRDD